jgi:hypothetical protein
MAEEYDEAFGYEWLTRRWVKVLASKEAQYATHLFPFSVIGATGWELPNWVQGYEAFWNAKVAEAKTAGDMAAAKVAQNHAFNAKEFGEHLQGITGQYQISSEATRLQNSNAVALGVRTAKIAIERCKDDKNLAVASLDA